MKKIIKLPYLILLLMMLISISPLKANKTTPTITWATPVAITYGTVLSATQLNATASVAGTFTYSPAAGTILNAGVSTLSLTFVPSDTSSYNTVTKSVSIVVNKASTKSTPTITWANPDSIKYGTALTATQLNATASVAGTFSYSPAAGTILSVGVNTLNLTFTPSDTSSYTTVTKSVSIYVYQGTVVKTYPTITWANPSAITYGTVLSATQLNATASVAGTYTYSPTAGTILSVGTDTLRLTFTPTDTASYYKVSAWVKIVVNKASTKSTPTITWANPDSIKYGTALTATQLNATASVAGTFSYSPAAGTILSVGVNTLNLTFTPSDTSSYTKVTKSVSIYVYQGTVVKTYPTITWANPSAITYGTVLSATQLNATASIAGTYTYSPTAGTILSVGTDTLRLTFTPTDTASYYKVSAWVKIVVNKASTKSTPTITWANPDSIKYGTALTATQLNATASVAGTFSYSPAAGTILSVGVNTLNLTFTPSDTSSYTTVTKSVSIYVYQGTVVKTYPTITWANPSAITYGTVLSATQLNATASVAGTFTYSPAVGTILSVGTDTLRLTFTPTDTASYYKVSAWVKIVVNKASTKSTPTITWANPDSIKYGTALTATQLNATASVAGTFSYSPAAGTILSIGVNTLNLTFTPSDTSSYTKVTKSVSIYVYQSTVVKTYPTITWANPAAITYGTTLSATQLNATASVAGTFTYSPAVGTILSVGTDTLRLTFTPTDTASYYKISTWVKIVVNKASTKSTPTITWANPAAITYGTALSAIQLNASASVAGTFTYTPAAGTILNAGVYTLNLIFIPTDTSTYSSVTKSVSIIVNQSTVVKTYPTITWANPAAITYGTALSATQLNATASVAGTFTYSPAVGTILSVGTDTLRLTFTPTDTASYYKVSAWVKIVVNKAAAKSTPTITWANPDSIKYGTALTATQLNATASVAGTFSYSPAAGTILSIGVNTLNLTFTPSDTSSYTKVTKSVSIYVYQSTVVKTYPTITWANPSAITYGTALSATQLNATASVAGTYTYSPAAGTILSVGTDTLKLTFTPADTSSYYIVNKSVIIKIITAVSGCTDPSAKNYNSLANVNDGSCIYNVIVYGCTDSKATNYDSTATVNNGSCVYASVIAGCTDSKATNYNSLANISDGSCKYNTIIWGCTDSKATNYNANATKDDGYCKYDSIVSGCTDITASNYNPVATYNNGTCQYTKDDVYGCTDKAALNYNPYATINNKTCIYRVVSDTIKGCTDTKANNYNPAATISGTCTYDATVVKGCTSATAINYNPLAKEDDNSCVYAKPLNSFIADVSDSIAIKDTIGASPVSSCSLNASLPIDSARITSLTNNSSSEVTATWKVWQAGSAYEFSVVYTINQSGNVLFNLSVICKSSRKKSTYSQGLSAFTVQSVYYISNTSNSKELNSNSLHSYPNPVSNIWYLSLDNISCKLTKVSITNLSGQLISDTELSAINGQIIPIDVHLFKTGIYLAKFTFSDGSIILQKMVKY